MKITRQDVTTILSNSNIRDFDKNIINRFISNLECDIFKLQEKFKLADNDKQLIEEVTKMKMDIDIILSTEDVVIYKVASKKDWYLQYPYRAIYRNKEGNWVQIKTVMQNLDIAYLNYLEHKHLGLNSQFAEFAIKMLTN